VPSHAAGRLPVRLRAKPWHRRPAHRRRRHLRTARHGQARWRLQGFNIDLGEELAKRLGRKIEIEGTEFSGLVPGLNAKKYDFLLAPVTVTPERAKSLLFTEGYLDTDYTFVGARRAPALEALEDLKGKTVAVNKGSTTRGWARDNAAKYGFKYDVYGANADAVQAVQSGRADANLAGTTVVAWAAKQNPRCRPPTPSRPAWCGRWPSAWTTRPAATPPRNALKCMKKPTAPWPSWR
jgi:hypothetical protein